MLPCPWYRTTLVALLAILSAVFWVDQPLFLWLKAWGAQNPDALSVFHLLTHLGKSDWILWPTGLVCLLTLLLLASQRVKRHENRLRRIAQKAGFVFAAVAGAGLSVNLLKFLFGRARPKMLDEGFSGFYGFQGTSEFWSFPSGHANTTFALALAVSTLYPQARLPLLIFATLVAATRIMVGAHYLADIIAGALIAFLFVLLLRRLFAQRGWL